MKAQFFIISSVIMIYVIVLTFQYMTGFSDIRLSGIEEHQELSYIKNIKDSFIQTLNTSNISNNGDLNKISKDIDFTKNFFKQELLKKGINFDSKFIFFSNGFETGDLSRWSDQSGSPAVVSDTKYDGEYSLYSNGAEYVYKKLDGINEVYARVYVNFKTLPSASNTHYFLGFYDHGTQILMLGLYNDGSNYNLRINSIEGNFWSRISISNYEWHYYDIYWYANVTYTSTIMEAFYVWYDGNLIRHETFFPGIPGGQSIDEYRFGGVSASGGIPDLFVDCVAIGSDYIGGDCYPDEQPYFVFNLKTKEMHTKTEFPYEEVTTLFPSFGNVLWLKFNEGIGTNVYDSSVNGNNGVFSGESFNDGTSYPTDLHTPSGKYGKALQFDGVNNYVQVADTDSLDLTGNLTLEAWIKTGDNSAGYKYIIGKDGSSPWPGYAFALNPSVVGFYSNNGGGWKYGTITVNDNNWHHVAITLNGTSLKFYVDGTFNREDTSASPSATTVNLRIGADGWAAGQKFNGTIDEVRIFNKSLSQTEISAEMNSSIPVKRSVAAWSFEESGNYVNDTHIWVNGTFGSALSFDGIDDYVNCTNYASLNLNNYNEFTLEAWVYFKPTIKSGDTWPMILGKGPGDSYAIQIDNSSRKFGFWGTIGGSAIDNTGTSAIPIETWSHIAVRYNGTYINYFLNSVDAGSISASGTVGTNSNNLSIGSTPGRPNYLFNGVIDEVRIYSRALSQTEIQNDMNSG